MKILKVGVVSGHARVLVEHGIPFISRRQSWLTSLYGADYTAYADDQGSVWHDGRIHSAVRAHIVQQEMANAIDAQGEEKTP
jgi:hypothetical protein